MLDLLWAATAVLLAYVSLLASPFLFLAVTALFLSSFRWRRAFPALVGAAMGTTFAFALEGPIAAGVAVGAAAGWLLQPHLESSAGANQLLHRGVGLLVGLLTLSFGAYLPLEWVCGWGASLVVLASRRKGAGLWVAGALFVGFTSNLVTEFLRPKNFLFYQQVHASALDLFNRVPVDSTYGIEAFRAPRGRIYIGNFDAWISDGGRYIENPSLAPLSFALRWQALSESPDDLLYGGIVTPELCERFPRKPLRYLKSELTFFADPCPLAPALNLDGARHLMLFEPLETDAVSRDASFPDGKWTRWHCAIQSVAQGRTFLKKVLVSGPTKVYQLSFRSAECLVRAGPAMSEPEAMERDPVLARFMNLEGAI